MACRYGNQDYFRVVGRDPIAHPMTMLEVHLFNYWLKRFWENEQATPEDPAEE